jgi:hypothetical protein
LGEGEGVSSIVSLGRLERVELRDAWPHEASNFTPWLAQPDNLALLSETLGLELAFEAMEKPVDSFSADILAKDVATDRWVLIENQLEQTDHTHLGQILTYAAGLDAETIVWIAKEFREPHRAAIDYLNRISAPEFNFFGIQVELFRIGSSDLAPRFNLVAKPNDWSREVLAKAVSQAAASERGQHWQEYWSGFFKVAEARSLKVATKTAPKEGWCRIEQLKSGDPNIAAWVHRSNAKLRALVWLKGQKRLDVFDGLELVSAQVSQHTGLSVFGDRLEHMKSSLFGVEIDAGVFEDRPLSAQYEWYAESVAKLLLAVKPHLSSGGMGYYAPD